MSLCEFAATFLNRLVLLILILFDMVLVVVKARSQQLFETLPDFVLRHRVLSFRVEQVEHGLGHRVPFDLVLDRILVIEDVNIFIAILEPLHENPIKHLVNKFHHFHIFRFEQLLEAPSLERLQNKLANLSLVE